MRHLLMALSSARPGREDSYDTWFVDEHLPDVLAIPGFVSARPLARDATQLVRDESSYDRLTLYEIESDDLATTLKEFRSRVRDGRVRLSDDVDPDRSLTCVFSALDGFEHPVVPAT